MAYLANPFGLASVLAAAVFFAIAAYHVLHATRLAAFINAQCPDLWDQILWSDAARQRAQYLRAPARRLDSIILYNRGARHYPDDPEFRRLLRVTRWSAICCLLSFTAAIILLAKATS